MWLWQRQPRGLLTLQAVVLCGESLSTRSLHIHLVHDHVAGFFLSRMPPRTTRSALDFALESRQTSTLLASSLHVLLQAARLKGQGKRGRFDARTGSVRSSRSSLIGALAPKEGPVALHMVQWSMLFVIGLHCSLEPRPERLRVWLPV